MSDRLIEDNDVSVDKVKEQAIAKHNKDLLVMAKLIFAINEYIIHFGRTSNVHDECMNLKAQVTKNKEHLEEWVDKI
tara:strand:- start:1009 stop:1239 length:231 start_codon:yes stop_codon:yes gene_type:complete